MCVYIVLEHSKSKKDAFVHGVYSSRGIANNKVASLLTSKTCGYVCVLKKTVQGPLSLQLLKIEKIQQSVDRLLRMEHGVYS